MIKSVDELYDEFLTGVQNLHKLCKELASCVENGNTAIALRRLDLARIMAIGLVRNITNILDEISGKIEDREMLLRDMSRKESNP